MKIRIISCLLALALLLSGCSGALPGQQETVAEFTETVAQTEGTVPSSEPVETEPAQIPPAPTEGRKAFAVLLERMLKESIAPDGEALPPYDGFGLMSENKFAVEDVDGDGGEELIVMYSTTVMAGMCGWVVHYDAETDATSVELTAFPSINFYTGGLAELELSHNHGRGGALLWPYTLVGFNPATKAYEEICMVDSWDRAICPEGYPEELDPENVGTVFEITRDGETVTYSQAEFEAWRAELYGSAQPIELVYQNLTEENIAQLLQ